jgi:hypothetical protein
VKLAGACWRIVVEGGEELLVFCFLEEEFAVSVLQRTLLTRSHLIQQSPVVRKRHGGQASSWGELDCLSK